jgi:hypothetical protein
MKLMAWTRKKIVWGAVLVLLALAAATLFYQRHNIANRMMVSGGERAVANHIATPVNLNGRYRWPASSLKNSWSWSKAPWGFQVFRHVPLQIGGVMPLWGAGNAKTGNVFPKQILGIAVNEKFETLYVYHCTFYGSPKNTPVYDLVFRYEDGDSETNTILYGVDTLDYDTGGKKIVDPSGPNTKVAWVGSSFTPDGKQPLLFSLTAIKNPQPFLKITSIDLFSSTNQSAGVILAMTGGPAGLMK